MLEYLKPINFTKCFTKAHLKAMDKFPATKRMRLYH